MTRTITLPAAFIALAALASGCDDKAGTPPADTAPPAKTAAAPPAPPPPTAPPAPPPAATAEPSADDSAEALLAKKYKCGAKGQTPCPMQGWMKKVMATASSSGDGAKLAEALNYVAAHAPPGYPKWTDLAKAGAAKAKAGDIDGAKESCKACHDTYKDSYKAAMRDRPF